MGAEPTDYFRGGYVAGSDRGKVTGCTKGNTKHLIARYVSDKSGSGRFDITFTQKVGELSRDLHDRRAGDWPLHRIVQGTFRRRRSCREGRARRRGAGESCHQVPRAQPRHRSTSGRLFTPGTRSEGCSYHRENHGPDYRNPSRAPRQRRRPRHAPPEPMPHSGDSDQGRQGPVPGTNAWAHRASDALGPHRSGRRTPTGAMRGRDPRHDRGHL